MKDIYARLARANARKLLLELFDAAGSVDKALFAGIGGVGIARDVAGNHIAVHAIYLFNLLAFHG